MWGLDKKSFVLLGAANGEPEGGDAVRDEVDRVPVPAARVPDGAVGGDAVSAVDEEEGGGGWVKRALFGDETGGGGVGALVLPVALEEFAEAWVGGEAVGFLLRWRREARGNGIFSSKRFLNMDERAEKEENRRC